MLKNNTGENLLIFGLLHRSRSSDTPMVKSTSGTQVLLSKYHSSMKRTINLWRNGWSILQCEKVRKCFKKGKRVRACQKDTEVNLKDLMAKGGKS